MNKYELKKDNFKTSTIFLLGVRPTYSVRRAAHRSGGLKSHWTWDYRSISKKAGVIPRWPEEILEVRVSIVRWNPMFSYISSHWRGQPLESYEAIINLIGSTTTKKGIKVKAKLDKRKYRSGRKISDEDFAMIKILKNRTLPKWNYTILPI